MDAIHYKNIYKLLKIALLLIILIGSREQANARNYDLIGDGIDASLHGDVAIIPSDASGNQYMSGNEPFEPVPPTGLPYNIVLTDLDINGQQLPIGAQIGVFDGELCVGDVLYDGSDEMNLVAWEADPDQNLAGFTSGNTMTFKYHVLWHSLFRNFDADVDYIKGDGTFGFNIYSVVDLSVTTSLIPDITVSSEILNFNTVVVNESKTMPLILENNGTAPLFVHSVQNTDNHFTLSAMSVLVDVGGEDTLWVTFTPTEITTYSDILTMNTDDPDTPTLEIPLYGTGLPQTTPQISVIPSSLNFGGIAMNSTSTLNLNVYNAGNGVLEVTGITSSNAAFAIFGSTSFTLEQGENTNVALVFSPTTTGLFNGQLSIQNNDELVYVPVHGVGSQGHFSSVDPTGKPYPVIVEYVDIDGFRPGIGDEIAVFDDDLCVGIAVSNPGGNSLYLDGSGDYLVNDNSTAFDLQEMTISAWVYSSNFSQNGFIFEKGPVNTQYSLFFEGSSINFRTYPSGGAGYDNFYLNSASIGITNSEWHFITATFDGEKKKIFVDGELKATRDYTKTLRTGQQGQIIGAYGATGSHSYYFNGNIDEVRIWDYARTIAEIQNDMFWELTSNEQGLVAYWNFDDGSFANLVSGSTNSYLAGGADIDGGQNPEIISNIMMTTWEKDDDLGLPGFTSGNPMTFKVWTEIYDNWVEVDVATTYIVGNGNFGYGQLSVVSLEGTTGLEPDIDVPFESIYVGQVTVGEFVVNEITVHNTGNAPLHIAVSDNSDAFSPGISIEEIPPMDSITFELTFTPTVPGGYSAELTIESNDPDEPEIIVGLEGFALPSGSADIATSVDQLSFGDVIIDSTKTATFTVINTGTAALVVSSISNTDPAFTVMQQSFTLENTNDLMEVVISFSPDAKGLFSDLLTIVSNAPNHAVSVIGVGYENHFNLVAETGKPYHIIIDDHNLTASVQPGDELVVFDGELAVGMASTNLYSNTRSATFDGSGDYLEVANSETLNPSMITVEAWVKTTDGGTSRAIVAKTAGCANTGYLIWLNQSGYGAGKPGFWVGNGGWLNANIAIHDGQWHHVAGTYDGVTAKIYVDGVFYNSRNASEDLSSTNVLQIGGSTYCGNYLNGKIDEVKIWDYALNQEEVNLSMSSRPQGTVNGLLGYWPFEGDFSDQSDNNHPTQINGNVSFSADAPTLQNYSELTITAWEKDDENGLPGFTPGNEMSFKLWTEINGIASEFSATPTYSVGDGTFGFGQFSVAALEFDLPLIEVDPVSVFVALEEPNSTTKSINITNNGTATLSLNASIDEAWGVIQSLPATIAASSSDGLVLEINTAGLIDGIYEAIISINSNDPINDLIEVPLTLNVTGSPQITSGLDSLGVGKVVVAEVSENLLTLTNIGTKVLVIDDAFILDGGNTGFSFSLPGKSFPVSIDPAESIEGTLSFAPLQPGEVIDTLRVLSNAGNAPSYDIVITGEGITPPEIYIPETSFSHTFPCSDVFIDSVKVYNIGQEDLEFESLGSELWLTANPSQATVAGGDSITLYVNISTLDLFAGVHEATLNVTSNDPGQALVEVFYIITVIGDPAILANDYFDIGIGNVGDTVTGQLMIANSGCDTLDILSVDIQSQYPVFYVENPEFSIPPGDASPLMVAFVPTTTQQYSGIVTINSNDAATPSLPVVLAATGVEPPNMEVSPLSIATTLQSGDSQQKLFTVQNIGGQTLVFDTDASTLNRYMMHLDGNGDYINVVHSEVLNAAQAITLEAWLLPLDNTTEFIMGKENSSEGNYRLWINADHRFEFRLNKQNSLTSNTIVPINQWIHVAASFDGETMRLFVNGVLDAEQSFGPFTILPNTDNLRIGRSFQYNYFDGMMDEVRIWNIARNQSEIQSIMNQPPLGTEPELVLYFPFVNAFGNIVTDESANSNNGILYGNPVRQSSTVSFDDYLAIGNGSGSLGANLLQNVNLALNSSGFPAGTYQREILVTSNAAKNPSDIVSLSLTIEGLGLIEPSPDQMVFADVFLGLADTMELVLENTGASAAYISGLSFSSDVFFSLNQVEKVFPFSQKTIMVVFEPSAIQLYNETLTVFVGDAKSTELQIPLTGLGVTPPIPEFSPAVANFGDVVVSNTGALNIALSNAGSSALEVYSATLSDDTYFATNIQLPVTLAYEEEAFFDVFFSPLDYALSAEELILNTNIGLVSLSLNGTGVPPDHDLSIVEMLSPQDGCGLSGTELLTVTIQNFGELPQSNFDVGFSLNGGSSVEETVAATLESGQSMEYSFMETLDLSALGVYDIELFTLLGNDQNTWNDTTNYPVTNFPSVGEVSGLMPADSSFGVVEPVAFSWDATANADVYDLYLWRTNQQKPDGPSVEGILATNYTWFEYLNKNYLYNWQIVARNQCSQSESEVNLFSFNVFSDLTVDEVIIPASGNSGEDIEITFSISNIGTGSTGIIPWKDKIFISTLPVFDPDEAELVAEVSNLSSLSMGQGYTNIVTITLADYLEGAQYVYVQTDARNIIQETNEDNNLNVSDEPIVVSLPPYPDLFVEAVESLSGDIVPGQTVSVGWSVENIGDADAIGGWSQRVSIVKGAQRVILGYLQYNDTLAASGILAQSVSFNVPKHPGLAGEVFLEVKLTPYPDLVEKPNATANNVALSAESVMLSKKLFVTATQPTIDEDATNPLLCGVYRSGNRDEELVVNLSFSVPDRIILQPNVTIPANQSGVIFYVIPINNDLIEGDIDLDLIAENPEYPMSLKMITIIDDELPSLTLDINLDEATEGEMINVTVTRDLVTDQALVVSLSANKVNQIALPISVEIPANEASVSFDVNVIDDNVMELTKVVTISAMRTGYFSGSDMVTVLDDDLQQIEFTLSPDSISEAGGPYASWGTILLPDPADGQVIIQLSAEPLGQLFFPQQVTIPNGQMEAQINVGAIDNGVLDGDRVVNFTAAIYISSCGCGAPLESGGAVTLPITILDNDGPSLAVVASPIVVAENLIGAGTLLITRNTLGGDELTVTLQHNSPDEIVLPATAIIPEGEDVVEVPFNTLDDGVQDGDQIVSVTVSAAGFSNGTCWVMVSDRNLPDFVLTDLSLSQNSVLINDQVDLTIQIKNNGAALAPQGAQVKIWKSTNNVWDANDAVLATMLTPSILAIGAKVTLNKTITLTGNVGDYYLFATVNKNGTFNELLGINNTSQPKLISVYPDYNASVTVDGDEFNGSTPITIYGVTEAVAKVPAANKPVDIYIIVDGVRRVYPVTSDDNGEFSMDFYPLNGEAGDYSVGACYPNQGLSDAQDEFVLLGAKHNVSSYIIWELYLGETQQKFIEIENLSSLPLNNVSVEIVDSPPGCNVSFIPVASLPGNSYATLSYSVQATDVTEGTLYEEVILALTSDEGTRFEFSTWFYCSATMGNLKLLPVVLNESMVKDQINHTEFQVKNNGLDETGLITIALPDLDWMALASPDTISSLLPGESAIVTLSLTPGEDLQLNNPITGQIALSGTNSNSVGLPFSFEPISDETGDLLVDVVDEYTYNTTAAPHLDSATVTVTHPYTGQIIAQGLTDANGHFLVEDINEGYYTLKVRAPQHAEHQDYIYIEKGVVNQELVFIAFQAITYSWEVIPTLIEDEYEITLITVFETNVPAPVVTMNMPDTLPALEYGEYFPFILTMTNEGLITAEEVAIDFPGLNNYMFTANVGDLDILPQTTVQIPVVMERQPPDANPTAGDERSGDCAVIATGDYKFECGPEGQWRVVFTASTILGEICPGNGGGGGGGWGWWGGGGCCGGGPGGPGGGTTTVGPNVGPSPPYVSTTVACTPCLAAIANAALTCGPISMPPIGIVSKAPRIIPFIVGAYAAYKAYKAIKGAWDCGYAIGTAINICAGGASASPGMSSGPSPELIQARDDLLICDKAFTAIRNIAIEVHNGEDLIEKQDYGILSDSISYNLENTLPIDQIRQDELINIFAQSDITEFELLAWIAYWNTTMEAWENEIYSPTPEYPEIIDTVMLSNFRMSLDTAINYALNRGFPTIDSLYNYAFEIVEGYVDEESTSVCATVTVQFSQTLTMTREAFEGTLTIFNGHDTEAMQNILLDLEVRDEEGILRNDLFQINTQSLNEITGIDGSGILNALMEGSAVILFIPERGAAPTVPRYYSFGGSLSYLDPFTGEIFEQDLFPVTLQVNPSPNLYLNYFMQRTIFGDDALTLDKIEPMIPAELAVMIDNQGAGTALSVNIESAQPEIIENEKGLLIDFEIIGSSLSGEPVQLGILDVDFGDIPGGEIAVGQWWFTSTLLGHFISYEASVKHLDSYGNPDLSLVSGIEIHELIKSISVYGPLDDTINDFLVNDIPDADDIPDAIYYSNGAIAQVVEAESSETDGPVNLSDTVVQLTVTPSAEGWNYTKLDDPGNGLYQIASCIRNNDGQVIPLENIWLTYSTIPDGGEPIYENKLHFVDDFSDMSAQTYTIVFAPIDQDVPEVVAVNGIPEEPSDTPVENVEVVFSEPIEPTTFNHEDMTLKNQGGPNLMDSLVIVSQINDSTFNVDISEKTAQNGYYALTVQAAEVADLVGNYGLYGVQVGWIQAIATPAIDYFFGLPEVPAGPIDTLLVLFNMPINETTFTSDQIVMTDHEGNPVPTASLVITSESYNSVLFKISGLEPFNMLDGTYELTFKLTEIQGETGQVGVIDQSVEWTVCQIPLPIAVAGSDDSMCVGELYQLSGTVENASSIIWSTSGTGSFDDDQLLTATYTASQEDIDAGFVEITLTAEPLNECAVASNSTFTLTVESGVEADAGEDATICEDATFDLFGFVDNADGFEWISSGDGSFNDPGILTPSYMPGGQDIESGQVQLSLVAQPMSPCILVDTSSIVLTIQKLPIAIAGDDVTICENQSHQLSALVANYNLVIWFSSGDGTFTDRQIPNPIYTPGPEDISKGYTDIALLAQANNPCYIPAISVLKIYFDKLPFVSAGSDVTICESQVHQLIGIALYQSSFIWETTGDGTFENDHTFFPMYTPGTEDLQNGTVQISITAQAVSPCEIARSDFMMLDIQKNPLADAGISATICENQSYQLSGSAQNADSFLWETSGDGSFDNASLSNAVYTPGLLDIQNLSVELSLTVGAIEPCVVSDVSAMTLAIKLLPTSNAGEGGTICHDEVFILMGTLENAAALLWSTNGDGSFDDPASAETAYTPGENDAINGEVVLTLSAEPQSPCTVATTDTLTLVVHHCQDFIVPMGWSGISSWVEPEDGDPQVMFTNVINDLIILQSQVGVFWPGQNVNTIGNWNMLDGYSIKVSNEITLTVAGSRSNTSTLQLSAGWNLIPVLSSCNVDVDALFNGKDVVIVKEVAGSQIYWPDLNINNLVSLLPGKAYFVLMNSLEEINFPGCTKAASFGSPTSILDVRTMLNTSGWDYFELTPITHSVAIPQKVADELMVKEGDLLGAFDQFGNCYGVVEWKGKSTILALYGDDPMTADKDGFVEGEQMYFRFYLSATQNVYELDATFDEGLPHHDGQFYTHGLSAISGLKLGSTQITEPGSLNAHIYPNPASDKVYIDLDRAADIEVTLFDIHGQEVLKDKLHDLRNQLDISRLTSGVYLIKLEGEEIIKVERLVKK